MRVHRAASTSCHGSSVKKVTAVAFWKEDLERLRHFQDHAKKNGNRLRVVCLGTHGPAITSDDDVRIASLNDLRCLRYVPCEGGEFCFSKTGMMDAIARDPAFNMGSDSRFEALSEALPHEWRTTPGGESGGDEVQVLMMALKVVFATLLEEFVPWNLDDRKEWSELRSFVDAHGKGVFDAVSRLERGERARMAACAASVGRYMHAAAVTFLQRMHQVDLVCKLTTNCYATCVDHGDMRTGYPAGVVCFNKLITVYTSYEEPLTGDWALRSNRDYHDMISYLTGAMEPFMYEDTMQQPPPLNDFQRHQVFAYATAWMSESVRLSAHATVIGGGDWMRLGRSLIRTKEGLEQTGVLALSGRLEGLALITECPTMLKHLSYTRRTGLTFKEEPGGLGRDQMRVEAALAAMVGDTHLHGRLLGVHAHDGETMRELLLDDAGHLLPERWMHTMLRDVVDAVELPIWAFPAGVMLPNPPRPPMDTFDPLCGLQVVVRKVHGIVIVEPASTSVFEAKPTIALRRV